MKNQDLKKVGLKITSPRLKIINILEQSENHHLSAEDIHQALIKTGEDIGLATVYRVLTQFEAASLVTKHHFEGGHSVFELNQGEHHDHLVCVKCGKVAEFFDELIEQQQKFIAHQSGFNMTDHSLTIYGICQDCQ